MRTAVLYTARLKTRLVGTAPCLLNGIARITSPTFAGCADCLKDLQRFLRQDDPVRREAFFALGQCDVAKSDLVSIITAYPEDMELVYNACAP